jgi:phosphinothricin acetyltransferase
MHTLRAATGADLLAIDRIYDHYVHHSTCTAQLAPAGIEERRRWFDEHDAAHPIVVVEIDGAVAGWGSLSVYNRREGYGATVEDSVYIDHARRGQGLGTAILADLVQRAGALGHRTIIAGITADQRPSVQLHARHGFVEVGRLRDVVRKFGTWLDVLYMQKTL